MRFSLTTNGTLLRPEGIEWLVDNEVGVTVSIRLAASVAPSYSTDGRAARAARVGRSRPSPRMRREDLELMTAPQLRSESDRNSRSDGLLMEGISRGDVAALETLMERNWSGLVAYSARMIDSHDEAEDIAQEVFARVWEHRARWTLGGSAQAYLYRIARNLVLLQLDHREVRGRTAPEMRHRSPKVATPFQHAVASEFEEAFEEALEALPPRRREAFSLVRLQGLSPGDVAEVMGTSRRTVANHVYMAARELEEALRPFLT